ncbi:MAG: leucyl/phenylalanyl-tRNA--protein transferase [Arenicellales bacterium]|nr:leucyl/phenylalanyl-tRNA--protein transferase [Arenicellales bacterium]
MSHSPIDYDFPPLDAASPEGLLAIGGDLCPDRILSAYRRGIFPWFSGNQPILWWSPDPRAVLLPSKIRISRSLKKNIRNRGFRITTDRAFVDVVKECAKDREQQKGTWITTEMRDAYTALHSRGHAHSVETWQNGELVGGLYGISIGKAFFGESMFARVTDSSKTALVGLSTLLTNWEYHFIDCQVRSSHLDSLGAKCIPRNQFSKILERAIRVPVAPHHWTHSKAGSELL